MNRHMETLTKGIIKENPLLALNIGLCSSLGVTTSITSGIGMGMAMIFVLVMSELVISIFRKLIPSAIRLPVFIIVIAAFTTIVQMVLKAYVTSLYDSLGVFLPLIVVNCIIMGRVEAFASKNTPGEAVLDAAGMGVGYTLVLVAISFFREFLGNGAICGTEIIPESYRIGVLASAPGGFIVFGCLGALMQGIRISSEEKKSAEKFRKIEEKKSAEPTKTNVEGGN